MMLLVNKVPSVFDAAAVRAQVEQAYGCPVIAVLPHSDDLMALASGGIFALRYPDSPVTTLYRQAAGMLMEQG
jgi:MinD-like ATPase involved in chromosome partitioning or flagellar assembly